MKILEVLTKRRILGNRGERVAARYLCRHGYRILKRNFVWGDGEIDLIARKGDTIAFVEVKSRTLGLVSPKEPRPASAVTPEKQRKILRVASCFAPAREEGVRMRFDIVEVYFSPKKKFKAEQIVHLPAAFNRNSAQKRSR